MSTRRSVLILSAVGLTAAGLASVAGAQPAHEPGRDAAQSSEDAPMKIPKGMAREHEHLHEQLAAATAAGGRTAEAARDVERHLAPHFEEENRYALPPLGLLPRLAKEGASEDMRPAIELARHVEQNFDRLLEEHAAIGRALDALEAAANAEGKPEAARFAAELRMHAQAEEELFYPTTVLIGRYLERELGTR